jgi:hypothetical protein
MRAVTWVAAWAGGVLVAPRAAGAQLCQNVCGPTASCETECQYPPAWPHNDRTCGSWWLYTGTGYFHETGRGEARWVDAHRHQQVHVDFWTGTWISESDGCYQQRERCEGLEYHGSHEFWGYHLWQIQSDCDDWGCNGHTQCRACEGTCM